MFYFNNRNYIHKKFGGKFIVKIFFIFISISFFIIFGGQTLAAPLNECSSLIPNSPCIIYTPNTRTSGNVMANLTGIGNATITEPYGQNWYQFINTGNFTFKFKESSNSLPKSLKAEVDRIDRTSPSCGVVYSTKGEDYFGGCTKADYDKCINGNTRNAIWTWIVNAFGGQTACIQQCSKNNTTEYNGSLTDENITAILTGCTEPITITNNDGSNQYIFTENGSFIFQFVDNAGNPGQVEAKVSKIHKAELSCNIEYSTKNRTNQDVTAYLTGCDFEGESINQSFIFTGNGSHTFFLMDNNNKTGEVTAKVDRIDKIAPTCTGVYSTNEETFGTVITRLTGCSETIYNSQTIYLFKKNGSYIFNFNDIAGNNGSYTATVTWIKENDILTGIQHEISGSTVYLTWNTLSSTPTDIDIFVWDPVYDTYQILGTIDAQEKNFAFDLLWDDGHMLKFEQKIGGKPVNYFIKYKGTNPNIMPICKITYDITSDTNTDVFAELSDCNENIYVTNNNGNEFYTFSNNGEFTFEFEDDYGNTGETTAKVTWIDKTSPTCNVGYSTTENTTGNVIAFLTGCNEDIFMFAGLESSYVFTDNGSYTFYFFDHVGNIGGTVANVDWIKSESPTETPTTVLTGIKHIIVEGQIIISWKSLINENVDISYKYNDGSYNSPERISSNNEYFLLKYAGEGIYEIKFEFDNKDPILYTIIVDPEPEPICNISYSTQDWTNQKVIATLSCDKTISIIGDNPHSFENNGSYKFRYSYGNGKKGEIESIVDRIDKDSPICGLWNYSERNLTNKDVMVTLLRSSDNGAGINISGGTCTITGNNQSCNIEISDNAGNTGLCSTTVTWIDKNKPILSEKTIIPQFISGHSINYTFSSNKSGNISYYGGCSGNTKNATSGNNTIEFNNLSNGIYDTCKITVTDLAGNVGELNISPFKINNNTPRCDIEYSTDLWTSGNVVANLARCTEGATGFNETGFNFTENGEFEFTFISEAGIEGHTTCIVSNIDKSTPICMRGEPSTSVLKGGTTGNIILTCTDTGAGIKTQTIETYSNDFYDISLTDYILNKDNIKYIFEYTAKQGIDGTFKFILPEGTITDFVGNNAMFDEKGIIIDNTIPNCEINHNNAWSNNSVDLKLFADDTNIDYNGYSRNGNQFNNTNTTTVYNNGFFTGYVKDLAGNIGKCTTYINTIDKTKPICGTWSYSTKSLTSGAVIAKLSESYDTGAGINMSGGICTISENNESCSIEISDNAGNIEICGSEIITRIDKKAPILSEIIPVPEVTAKIYPNYTFYTDEAGIINYSGDCYSNSIYATTGNNTIQFNELNEGIYNNCSITVTDSIGNISDNLYITQFEINTSVPTCDIIYDNNWTNQNLFVELTGCNSDNISIINNNGNRKYEFTGNGTFTFIFVNELGLTGYQTVNIINIDKQAPICGNWSYNPAQGNWTSGDVIAILSNSTDNLAGINISGGTCTISENNTSCSIEISDNVGNTNICTSDSVRWIDKDKPILSEITPITTPTAIHTPSYSFNTNEGGFIIYSGDCISDFGYAQTGINTLSFEYLNDNTYNNCQIALIDLAGNKSDRLYISEFKINSKIPTCEIEYSTTEWTNNYVYAYLTGCDNGITGFNETGHQFFTNDFFTFTFISETGIPGHVDAIVKNIDKQAPICGDWSYNPAQGNWTSGDIIAILSNSTDNLAGINISGGTCTISENNTSCNIEISDNVGNTNICTSDSVRWIDNTKPMISEIFPIKELSNINTPNIILKSTKDGTLLYSGYCEPQNFEISKGSNNIQFKKLSDGIYDNCFVSVIDYLGNKSDWLKLSTFEIKTTIGDCKIKYNITQSTNKDVIAYITGCNNITIDSDETSHTFTENGSFSFSFHDLAGNTGNIVANVSWIDKTSPSCSVSFTSTDTTNQPVVASISGCNEPIIESGLIHTFTENGSFSFSFHDLAGNTGNIVANVSWIDKTPPSCSVSYSSTNITNKPIIAYLSGCNETIKESNIQHTFNENGSFTFYFHDLAGNTGNINADVTWIIKEQEEQNDPIPNIKPICSIEYSINTTTSDPVIAKLTGCNVEITGNTLQHTFTGNGDYIFNFSSLSGIPGTAIATVNWIIQGHNAATNGDFNCSLDFDFDENNLIKTILTGCNTGISITNNNGNNYHIFDNIETLFDFIVKNNENIGFYSTKKWFFENFNTKNNSEPKNSGYIEINSGNLNKYLILKGSKDNQNHYTISGINLSGNNSTLFESDIECELNNGEVLFIEINTGGKRFEITRINDLYNKTFSFNLGKEYSYNNVSLRFILASYIDDKNGYCKIDNILITNNPNIISGDIKETETKDGYKVYKIKIKGLQDGEIIPINLNYNKISLNYKNCINKKQRTLGNDDVLFYKNGEIIPTQSTFAKNGDSFTIKINTHYQYFGSNSVKISLGKTDKSILYNIPILQKNMYNNILYNEERYNAYEYAYCYGITSKEFIDSANMLGYITRAELAKMISNYAINVLGKDIKSNNGITFRDISKNLDEAYDNGITKAYQLGLMGQNMPNNNFRPYDYVTRAEFATTLSRLLFNTPDGNIYYYTTHIKKLYEKGIISNVDPSIQELRGYVMLMLMRTYNL